MISCHALFSNVVKVLHGQGFSTLFKNFFISFFRGQNDQKKTKKPKQQRRKKNSISAQALAAKGLGISLEILKVINCHLPKLISQFKELPDLRERPEYSMAEIVMAGIFMFAFKEGSRNAFNNELKNEAFLENYNRLLGLRAPHMDTVERVLRELEPDKLENVKKSLVQDLLKKKAFQKFDGLKGRHVVAIDATCAWTFKCPPDSQPTGLHKTSCNGVKYYSYHVLEAKLVCPNGMVISLGSVWIVNEDKEDYEKQDCEHKAF